MLGGRGTPCIPLVVVIVIRIKLLVGCSTYRHSSTAQSVLLIIFYVHSVWVLIETPFVLLVLFSSSTCSARERRRRAIWFGISVIKPRSSWQVCCIESVLYLLSVPWNVVVITSHKSQEKTVENCTPAAAQKKPRRTPNQRRKVAG